ncbi:MAG: SPOR domain-containing protein [Betaproteobacteria bacterium]|nr:SPOR domain-containing protein [Betaproteobacteria bacterium]
MAKTVSEEEIQLRKRARRRLVGAVTLVIAAVVILPMLLDSKPEQRSQEIDIRIPPEDSAEELGSGAAAQPAGAAGTGDEATAGKSPAGTRQEDRITPEPPVKPAASMEPAVKAAGENTDTKAGSEGAKASTATVGATPAATDAFVVQLGAFSNPDKARQQLQSLVSRDPGEYVDSTASADARAYTETLKAEKGVEKGTGKSEITRVRVGPFRTREQAEATRQKLKKLGFDGVVTDK